MKAIIPIKISELSLDMDNPRFGELYTGSNKEEDLIEYLLFNESAISIAERLSATKEFYVDKPLLVFKIDNKYIVKDGNRRCAAVKALLNPQKYKINLPKCEFGELPVVVYENKQDIENRIVEEHTNSMFREWDRIAKAIEIYRQFQSGSSIESMQEIDSKPADLIKLASFYYEAVKIGKDGLKKLLRKGRGDTGGKTIIFERLFKYSDYFGYHFKNKPNYVIDIFDKKKFKKYIAKIVKYLDENPGTTHRDVDDKKEALFDEIGLNNFLNNEKIVQKNSSKNDVTDKKDCVDKTHRNKSQLYPQYNRTIPRPLKRVIDECYHLDELNFTNSKIAMSRVVFECCLKYVVEETKYNDKYLREYSYFKDAFLDKSGNKLKWTNFQKLKELFEGLIKNAGKAQAFKQFELDKPHQIIHNYNIAGLVNDSKTLCDNLIPLIEFMLDSEINLLNSVESNKLI